MHMRKYEDLKEKLCEELEEFANKPDMKAGDLETIHKLTDTIKNIDKITMLEDNEYSEAGDWEARGGYDSGNSYARRGEHYVRGHYSRDGRGDYSMRRGQRRGADGRYSRDSAKESLIEKMEEMIDEAGTERERETIKHCIRKLENM